MATIVDGRTLPFDWYSNRTCSGSSGSRIFRSTWQYAGRAGQVAEPGLVLRLRCGSRPGRRRPRQGSDAARVPERLPPPRLARLRGRGGRETLQCPYHAWTYGLDGSLRAAPRTEREPGFDKSPSSDSCPCRSMPGVRSSSSIRTPTPPPLAELLGELPELLAAAGLDLGSLRFLPAGSTSEYEANWKVCCENFLECYHCPDRSSEPSRRSIDVSVDAYLLETRAPHFSTQYGPVREAGVAAFDPRGPVARGQFHFLWPNITINVMPGHPNLSIGPVVPAERTGVPLPRLLRRPGRRRRVDRRHARSSTTRSAPRTPLLVERVQKGLRSRRPSSTAGCSWSPSA